MRHHGQQTADPSIRPNSCYDPGAHHPGNQTATLNGRVRGVLSKCRTKMNFQRLCCDMASCRIRLAGPNARSQASYNTLGPCAGSEMNEPHGSSPDPSAGFPEKELEGEELAIGKRPLAGYGSCAGSILAGNDDIWSASYLLLAWTPGQFATGPMVRFVQRSRPLRKYTLHVSM